MSQYSKDQKLKREVMMEHYSNPKFKGKLEKQDISYHSTQCVDELHIEWEFVSDKLKKAKWDGVGCAVFQSSADIFIELIINKSKQEIIDLAYEYENMINQSNNDYDLEKLGKLAVYSNVKSQLNRLYCANMISQAILKELD